MPAPAFLQREPSVYAPRQIWQTWRAQLHPLWQLERCDLRLKAQQQQKHLERMLVLERRVQEPEHTAREQVQVKALPPSQGRGRVCSTSHLVHEEYPNHLMQVLMRCCQRRRPGASLWKPCRGGREWHCQEPPYRN